MNKQPTTTRLSSTLEISNIMCGLWQIADLERKGTVDISAAANSMMEYVSKGITTFDMADHYGSAELIAGQFHKTFGHRTNAQFLTKWVPKPGPSSKEEVHSAVSTALDRMQTDSIDLLQFHAWNYADPSWLDSLFWLQELKEKGLIKNLGVTNFDAAHLRIAVTSGLELVSNQLCYSILDQRAANQMTEVCQEFNVKILAFGTLAGGMISQKWLNQPEPNQLTTWSQMKYKRFIEAAGGWNRFQQVLTLLQKVAQAKGCSLPNLASRFILQAPAVAGIIIGARLGKSDYISENTKLLDLELPEEQMKRIQKAIDLFKPIPGGCGDEYRKPPFLTASGDLSHHLEELPKPYAVTEESNKAIIRTGTIWEDLAGFSRGIMKGDRIHISGTTATHGNRAIGTNDPVAQTHFIIDKIEGVLQSFGASLKDVVRTRIYLRSLKYWESVAKAHGQRFKNIQPTNTMVQAELVGKENLVEIEAEADLSV